MESFSTQGVHAASRFLHWRDAVWRFYPRVELSTDAADGFAGAISTRMLGSMRVTEVSSGAQVVRRSARDIARYREDVLQLNFQVAGDSSLRQDARECVATPGTFVLYDSTRPYELRFSGPFKQLSIKLPRADFRTRYGSMDDFTARVIDGTTGSGRFLFGFAQQLVPQANADALLETRLQDHFGDLLMTAIRDMLGTVDRLGRSATLVRVKTYILSHLRDPELAPETIAAATGLSKRSLHALFEYEQTTLWRWLQARRLARCKADIEDLGPPPRSISDIAYSWGFSDAAHFSRLFRKAYGVSPRDCRQAAENRRSAG